MLNDAKVASIMINQVQEISNPSKYFKCTKIAIFCLDQTEF